LDTGAILYLPPPRKNPNFRVYQFSDSLKVGVKTKIVMAIFCCYIKIAKPLLNTLESRLWCKFLLAVFATMYLNDVQRGDFYATIGLDSRQFDKHVIRKTNQSEYSFPFILDVDRPEFF
jgi:hypothetical protein